MNFKLLISMIKSQKTERVVDAAKAAGATGATIIPARGTGIREAKTFLGLTLEVQTDVVLFLLEEELVESVLAAIQEAGQFKEAGTGIAFVLDVEETIGVRSQIEHLGQK
ncbi:MAG: P-II family nitrogen regulator [Thermodesulfobacteriota bacterium]|nr:P-II family nitrogen regulator [Thermodesulfobacteriota bacterium]